MTGQENKLSRCEVLQRLLNNDKILLQLGECYNDCKKNNLMEHHNKNHIKYQAEVLMDTTSFFKECNEFNIFGRKIILVDTLVDNQIQSICVTGKYLSTDTLIVGFFKHIKKIYNGNNVINISDQINGPTVSVKVLLRKRKMKILCMQVSYLLITGSLLLI